jgi:hypothetical protein
MLSVRFLNRFKYSSHPKFHLKITDPENNPLRKILCPCQDKAMSGARLANFEGLIHNEPPD